MIIKDNILGIKQKEEWRSLRVMTFLIFIISQFLILQSCSLDENPHDQIPEEEAYTSHNSLFRNTVATLYYYIGGYASLYFESLPRMR